MMAIYALPPLLLASPYQTGCSHSNQPLGTRVEQLDSVAEHRWLVAAPLSRYFPPPHHLCEHAKAHQAQHLQLPPAKGRTAKWAALRTNLTSQSSFRKQG